MWRNIYNRINILAEIVLVTTPPPSPFLHIKKKTPYEKQHSFLVIWMPEMSLFSTVSVGIFHLHQCRLMEELNNKG